MSIEGRIVTDPPPRPPSGADGAAGTGAGWRRPDGGTPPWRLSPWGVRTVAWLEVRRLMRARRWIVAWVLWTALVTGVCGLIVLSVLSFSEPSGLGPGAGPDQAAGAASFGVVVLVVLSFGLLVAPGLAATSINGDRREGNLATVQATLLSPAEIAVGKLLAAWAGTLALVAGAIPSLVIAFALGGTSIGRLLVVLLLVVVSLAVVTAFGLGLSAVMAKPVASVVVSYVVAFSLAVVAPLMVPLLSVVVQDQLLVTYTDAVAFDPETGRALQCETREQVETVSRTDLTWWLLAASPYVVVADAAPQLADVDARDGDVLRGLGDVAREARLGPDPTVDYCSDLDEQQRSAERAALPPVWPWGMAFYLLLTAGATVVAVRRLRTPVRRLPTGQRIA